MITQNVTNLNPVVEQPIADALLNGVIRQALTDDGVIDVPASVVEENSTNPREEVTDAS